MLIDQVTRDMITLALREDIGPGDVTSQLIPADATGEATFLAKQELVLAGTAAVFEVFRQLDPAVQVEFTRTEGTMVETGATMGSLRGNARSLLMGERVALNLLQRMCGIATYTRRCANAVMGTIARVVDTRKTTPGLRRLEKDAVRAGGGTNHRFGLYDGVLIKDNHIAAMGGVGPAIAEARALAHHILRIECEVTNLKELEEALEAGADVVLLDNMNLTMMEEAVSVNKGRAVLEASGNMTLERLPAVAATGVDYISMGALTHTVKAADISLQWTEQV